MEKNWESKNARMDAARETDASAVWQDVMDTAENLNETADDGVKNNEAVYEPVEFDTATNTGRNPNACNGLSKFRVEGKSRVFLDDDVYDNNPWQVKKNKHLMRTNGRLFTQKSSVDVQLYEVGEVWVVGGASVQTRGSIRNGVSDYIDEENIVRTVSNPFYLKADWNWEQIATTADRIVYSARIPADQFGEELPKPCAQNEIMKMNSDYGFNLSYEEVKTFNHTYPSVALIAYGMYYDSTTEEYVLVFNVYKTISSVSAFKEVVITLLKTFLRYQLRTPRLEKISNKLESGSDVVFRWETVPTVEYNNENLPVDISYPYKSMNIQVPVSMGAATTMLPLVQNINQLNYEIKNVAVQESKIGVGDGITDNAVLFQRMIDQLSIDGTNVLNLGGGDFLCGTTLNLPGNFVLNGNNKTNLIFSNTGAGLYIKGGNVAVKNLNITMKAKNTSEIGAITIDGAFYPVFINIENVTIKGIISENKTNPLNYYYNNIDDKTCGIYAFHNMVGDYPGYIQYLTVNNVTTTNLYCGVWNEAAPANYKFAFDYVVYGAITKEINGIYDITGHFRSMPNGDAAHKTQQIILNEAAALCTGSFNYFNLNVYDQQRSKHMYIFSETARNNMYNAKNIIDLSNQVYHPEMWYDDYDGVRKTYPFHAYYVKDLGAMNLAINQTDQRGIMPFVGGFYQSAFTTDVNESSRIADLYGAQDNALAGVGIWGNVTVRDKLGNDLATEGDISDIFMADGGAAGFKNGITIKHTPTAEDPIIIEIDLGTNRIEYTKIGAFWGIPPKSFSLFLKYPNTEYVLVNTQNDNFSYAYWYREKFAAIAVTKIKLELYEANTSAAYNPQGWVRLNYIYASDAQKGGKTWQPRHSKNLLTNAKDVEGAINELYGLINALAGGK